MKVAVLFSGGKDSCLALYKASKQHEIACLVSIVSKNPESYMFHVPNIGLTKAQAEAMELPIIQKTTEGKKEEELKELKEAINEAKKKYGIGGIVTGAIQSNYQASRIQKIADELELECINPLWQRKPEELWEEMLKEGFEIYIASVAAEGLGREWVGKKMDRENLEKLKTISKKFKVHLGFEGGEAETFVTDSPLFKKRIEIIKAKKQWEGDTGRYLIKKIRVVEKN